MVKKTDYNTKITKIENKILSVTGLDTTAAVNTILLIPDIVNLAAKVALNIEVVKAESKLPNINNLATKAALDTNATEIENKTGFITIP